MIIDDYSNINKLITDNSYSSVFLLLDNNTENQGVKKIERVDCITLEKFMKNNNIDRIDALKLDCATY